MDVFWRLFGPLFQRTPKRIDTDHVYPVHMLDDTKTLRSIVITWTLQFNDVLDPELLRHSLARLLEIGDWRKVGGRLRLKVCYAHLTTTSISPASANNCSQDSGELEIYVPQTFTDDRPAISFSHVSFPTLIEDHPLASTLPQATSSSSLQAGPQDFRAFAAREGAPETLNDFLYTDTPQLSLHITTFENATLVALSWPHTLMDVMGQQALLKSWSLVLADRESEVPPMLGARADAMCAVAKAPVALEKDFILGQRQLKGWDMFTFGLRFTWDVFWNRTVNTKTICLTRKAMDKMRDQAQSDSVIVSDGDLLTAWAARSVATSLPQPRPISVVQVMNTRLRLPFLMHAQGVYIQNMALSAFTFLPPDVVNRPLSRIALESRKHLMRQSTEPQILAFLRHLQDMPNLKGDPALVVCGEPNAVLMPFTNWTSGDFFNVIKFRAAVVAPGDKSPSRTNPLGTIVFHQASSMRKSRAVRNVFVVLGKDRAGNYWLQGTLLPRTWKIVEESLIDLEEYYIS